MDYDLIVIGGGPAGAAAGVYAARKRIKVCLITDSFGGQSLVSNDIQNWIGEKNMSGFDIAKKLKGHLEAQEDIKIIEGDLVVKINPVRSLLSAEADGGSRLEQLTSNGVEKKNNGFEVTTEKGTNLSTKTVLLTSGSRRRKLGITGEKDFEGRGVFYCSTCDAPLMKDKTAAVIGGGNSALEGVVDLIPYAAKIHLLHRKDTLKGDEVTQQKIKANPKVEIIYNAEIQEISGTKMVESISYKDKTNNAVKKLTVDGVFVEIGSIPNSEMVSGVVRLNERKEVVIDHKTHTTSTSGIWAAGDVSDVLYKQNNSAAGDAIKALLNIYAYLHRQE